MYCVSPGERLVPVCKVPYFYVMLPSGSPLYCVIVTIMYNKESEKMFCVLILKL